MDDRRYRWLDKILIRKEILVISKRKPFSGNKGLRFKYSVEDVNKITIESFLDTEFPKNNNPMFPTINTQIYDITWNSHLVTINENVCWI